MSKTFGGYGRYDDDPQCVGCEQHAAELLKLLVWELTEPKKTSA